MELFQRLAVAQGLASDNLELIFRDTTPTTQPILHPG
jgi:hypothetical protein